MANIFFVPCQPKLAMKHHRPCWHNKSLPKLYSIIRNQKTSSFSYKSTSNVPFYELPGASFDEYLENKQRVRQAVLFSDKVTTKKLNEEEWRIKLPPIQSIFLTVQPTADVRLTFKSNGLDYPNEIPNHITKILQIHIIKWELEGPYYLESSHLSLDIKGAIYPERIGRKSWLKNQMEMKISFCVSPTMSIVPENVMQDSVKLVFRNILDEMKKDFQGKLLADYSKFKKNKSIKNLV